MRGATITEVLVAVAILSIIAAASSRYLGQIIVGQDIEGSKTMQVRVHERLRNMSVDPEAIKVSMLSGVHPANDMLASCVRGTGCLGYTSAAINQQREFYLFNPAYDPGGGGVDPKDALPAPHALAGRAIVAGPAGSVCYADDGRLAPVNSPSCRYFAVSKFWGTCPISPFTSRPYNACNRPMYINVRVQLVPNTTASADGLQAFQRGSGNLTKYPPDKEYLADRNAHAQRVRSADVWDRLRHICLDAAGASATVKQVGTDQFGEPRCECITPFLRGGGWCPNWCRGPDGGLQTGCLDSDPKQCFDANKRPICGDHRCPGPPNKAIMMVGYDRFGRPKCIDQAACSDPSTSGTLCPCKNVDLSADGDCGAGFWMVSIEYGECYATSEKGKSMPRTVKCKKHNGRCCKLDLR